MKMRKGLWLDGWTNKNSVASILTMLAVTSVFMLAPAGANAQTAAQANLSWTDVTNEDSYRIERSDDGGPIAVVGTVGADVTTFLDDGAGVGLSLGVQYCWQVVSVNGFGEAPPSAQACATASVPGQVIGVQVIVSPF